ncbi:hypothetical protein CDAR_200161 [Caerostris darwini]|uniref:Uncharacterized protein n=1 Tax=Caerostris darwini TaxID=1538125 RepID=A0AAV4PNW5_9ARAC|nr:hypothetical protein CDAR_200161 [Caerostris darwini]
MGERRSQEECVPHLSSDLSFAFSGRWRRSPCVAAIFRKGAHGEFENYGNKMRLKEHRYNNAFLFVKSKATLSPPARHPPLFPVASFLAEFPQKVPFLNYWL